MDRIIFLGTGGARNVMTTQVLSTGGFILEIKNTMLSVDPGPGAVLRAAQEKVNINKLDGVLISHRHLDHCSDVNVMIEAMTGGGYKRKGVVFAPKQALYDDPVILNYLRNYVERIQPIEGLKPYSCRNLKFKTSIPHKHGDAETYGFIFYGSNYSLSYIPDTRYFRELAEFYKSSICIISTLMLHRNKNIDHLSVPDVICLIEEIKPQVAVLTHFGMQIYKEGVDKVADKISQAVGIRVIAAKDGMVIHLQELLAGVN
ncbi:MAG TPA: MBL fold hydrolase [Peptococcaceae bacterium]|nr:MAG: beta-lactamase domain-containing protein [Clostridia bacterium 41_269]HBT20829.1 MBL fold hydrolase [Peptococcaceae bacterium]